MAPRNVSPPPLLFNPYLTEIRSETAQVLAEAVGLAARNPSILAAVAADQDAYGVAKKRERQALKAAAGGVPKLGGLVDVSAPGAGAVSLSTGRPRLPSETVFLFLILRGLYGSLTDRQAADRFLESVSVRRHLDGRGLEMPGLTTLLENVNAVSNRTRDLIWETQASGIMAEGLDDGLEIMVDSTAVEAASAFPCDARMMLHFALRARNGLRRLEKLGLPAFRPGWTAHWLSEAKKLLFRHNMSKKQGKRRLYKALAKCVRRSVEHLLEVQRDMRMFWQSHDLPPRVSRCVRECLDDSCHDLLQAAHVLDQADRRVLEGQIVPMVEKVMSVCEADASIIVKGGREPVFGYKPGLARGGNGFVYGLRLQAGNPADAPELEPLIRQAIMRTGKVPASVIADDGYASKSGVAALKAQGVQEVTISGSKGKKLTPPDEWNAPEAQERRNHRSAVESLMFTLKCVVQFGRMRRRGLESVRAEMLEKIIAYNFRRIIQVREAGKLEEELRRRKAA